MRLGILTSWPLTSSAGSGVVTSVHGFALGLHTLGLEVRFVSRVRPARTQTGTFLRRVFYNGRLPRIVRRQARLGELEALLGFDFDGCYLDQRRRPPLTTVCGGTLADIVLFEKGWSRRLMEAQARLEGQNLALSESVVVPSRYAADAVRKHYPAIATPPTVLPLAIDVAGWEETEALEPAADLEPPVVLTVSRFYRRKSLDLLLRAWGVVQRNLGGGTLVLVGSGPEERSLRRTIGQLGLGGSVLMPGEELHRGRLKGWYRVSDLFCLPSRHETFGLVYLEAALQGLCTLALASTAVPEVVAHGETGILVADEEDEAVVAGLASAMEDLLKDDRGRARMGESGRRAAAARTWEDAARELIPLLG